MAWTLYDIQKAIAYEVDGNASISPSSRDWGERLVPINRALIDWSEAYDWSQLKKVHNGLISTASANASYAMPSDLRRLDGYPTITWDGRTTDNFKIVDPANNYQYGINDLYVNLLGSDSSGYVMYINAPGLVSGASVQFTYWAQPSSLTTQTQTTECPDPSFVSQKAMYYIYKQREDPRFPEAKSEADRILARMVENEATKGTGYVDRRVNSSPLANFRIGRD